jgi:hypothetical protein
MNKSVAQRGLEVQSVGDGMAGFSSEVDVLSAADAFEAICQKIEVFLKGQAELPLRARYFEAQELHGQLCLAVEAGKKSQANLLRFMDLDTQLRSIEKEPMALLCRAAEHYFRKHFASLGREVLEVSIEPKTVGVQIGAIMTFRYREGGQAAAIKYYLKYHGSSRDYQKHLPVDLKELLTYKLLEYLGLGPKAHFFCSLESPGECIVATQDLAHSKKEGVAKKLYPVTHEARVVVELNILSAHIFAIRDALENRDNYTMVATSAGKIKWKLLDFLMRDLSRALFEPGGPLLMPNFLEELIELPVTVEYSWMRGAFAEDPAQRLRTSLGFLLSLKRGRKKLPFHDAVQRATAEIHAFAEAQYRGLGIALDGEPVPGGDHRYRLKTALDVLQRYAALIQRKFDEALLHTKQQFIREVQVWADEFTKIDLRCLPSERVLVVQAAQRETLSLLVDTLPELFVSHTDPKKQMLLADPDHVGASLQQILMSLCEVDLEGESRHWYYETLIKVLEIRSDDFKQMRFFDKWIRLVASPMRKAVCAGLAEKFAETPPQRYLFYPKMSGVESGLRVRLEFAGLMPSMMMYVKSHIKKDARRSELNIYTLFAYFALAHFGLGPKMELLADIVRITDPDDDDGRPAAARNTLYIATRDLAYSRDPAVHKHFTLLAEVGVSELSPALKQQIFLLHCVDQILGLGDLNPHNFGYVQVSREGLLPVIKLKVCDFSVYDSLGGRVTRDNLLREAGAFKDLKEWKSPHADAFSSVVKEAGVVESHLLRDALDCLENGIPSSKDPTKRGPSFAAALEHAHQRLCMFFLAPVDGDWEHPYAMELLYNQTEVLRDKVQPYHQATYTFLQQTLALAASEPEPAAFAGAGCGAGHA